MDEFDVVEPTLLSNRAEEDNFWNCNWKGGYLFDRQYLCFDLIEDWMKIGKGDVF